MNAGHMTHEASLTENISNFIDTLYHVLELPFD